jgi:hypothetical protein
MFMNKKNITTALLVAVIVGTVLNIINSYDVIRIMLTYITPFSVSLYSSIKATKQKA